MAIEDPCAVCGSPSEARCTWPVLQPVVATAGSLIPGEWLVFPGPQAAGRRRRALVGEVQPHGQSVTLEYTEPGKRPNRNIVFREARILVERLAPCGAPVCDLHAREVGEDRRYCRDHWRAWEKVA